MPKIPMFTTDNLHIDERIQVEQLSETLGEDIIQYIDYSIIKQRAFLVASLEQFEGMYHYDSGKPLRYGDGSLLASFDCQHKEYLLKVTINALQKDLDELDSSLMYDLQQRGILL